MYIYLFSFFLTLEIKKNCLPGLSISNVPITTFATYILNFYVCRLINTHPKLFIFHVSSYRISCIIITFTYIDFSHCWFFWNVCIERKFWKLIFLSTLIGIFADIIIWQKSALNVPIICRQIIQKHLRGFNIFFAFF